MEEDAGEGDEGEGDEVASGVEGEGDADGEASGELLPSRPIKKVANQFNFCDRAALTYNNPYRVSFSLIKYRDVV